MMWNIDQATASRSMQGLALLQEEVLYLYETPLLFTARFGPINALCYKLDEFEKTDLYLLSQTREEVVSALRSGKLSVRGALGADRYWIVETNHNGVIQRHWDVEPVDLPRDFLPPERKAVHARFGDVPDTLEAVDAFFSVKFTGAHLIEGQISFRTFKTLVDNVYDVVNRVFTPSILEGRRRNGVFDFDIAQPRLASLSISVKNPVVVLSELRRRTGNDSNNLQGEIEGDLQESRSEFFSNAEKIIVAAEKGGLNQTFRTENFSWLDVISELSPQDGGDFDRVEINAATSMGNKRLIIGQSVGQRIRDAHRLAQNQPVVLRGKIVEVNDISATFVMRDVGGRDTTCRMAQEFYRTAQRADRIKMGARIHVKGNRIRRVRRDLLHVTEPPEFVE